MRRYLVEVHGVPLLLSLPFALALVIVVQVVPPTSWWAIAGDLAVAGIVHLLTLGTYTAFLQEDRSYARWFSARWAERRAARDVGGSGA